MQPPFTPAEARVLGSLVEKEATTPDAYPLSLAGLTTACNQTTNREPVMRLDEAAVAAAAEALQRRGIVRISTPMGSRVRKYEQHLASAMKLGTGERGVLAVLLLRGAQTAGELHARTARLADLADIDQVEGVLESLAAREPEPLVVRLPRRPGQKESRWAHLLSGPVDLEALAAADDAAMRAANTAGAPAPDDARVETLERRVDELGAEVAALRAELAAFRAQFQ